MCVSIRAKVSNWVESMCIALWFLSIALFTFVCWSLCSLPLIPFFFCCRKCHPFIVARFITPKMKNVLTIFLLSCYNSHKIFRKFFRCHRSNRIVMWSIEWKCIRCSQIIWRQIMQSLQMQLLAQIMSRWSWTIVAIAAAVSDFAYFCGRFYWVELNHVCRNVFGM